VNEPSPSSWLGRNWFWAVPLGCLSPVLLCGGCIGALFFTVFSTIRASEPYQEAVAAATTSPAVKAELGEPLEVGFMTNGNIQINNGTRTAKFEVPLKGSKKSATIYVDATNEDGEWEYARLEVVPEGRGKPIDLRPEPCEECAAGF
jgi:hypothetical protein